MWQRGHLQTAQRTCALACHPSARSATPRPISSAAMATPLMRKAAAGALMRYSDPFFYFCIPSICTKVHRLCTGECSHCATGTHLWCCQRTSPDAHGLEHMPGDSVWVMEAPDQTAMLQDDKSRRSGQRSEADSEEAAQDVCALSQEGSLGSYCGSDRSFKLRMAAAAE